MGKATYEQWKVKVDSILEIAIGLSSDDLPDQQYYAWFESGMTPEEAAKEVVGDLGI